MIKDNASSSTIKVNHKKYLRRELKEKELKESNDMRI